VAEDSAASNCQPPEQPSASAIIAAAVINIHFRKTGTPPAAYRQDLLWTTIPAKSSDWPGEPRLQFIPFSAWILERISTAPRTESKDQHGQTISNKHNQPLALNAAVAIVRLRNKNSFPVKYLVSMASDSFYKHPNDFIERLVPRLAWLCWLLHSDCTGSPASAIGHA
jgi:hypothetical protein